MAFLNKRNILPAQPIFPYGGQQQGQGGRSACSLAGLAPRARAVKRQGTVNTSGHTWALMQFPVQRGHEMLRAGGIKNMEETTGKGNDTQ